MGAALRGEGRAQKELAAPIIVSTNLPERGAARARQRIVVIGGGIVGVACASYLLRDSHEVTIVDPDGFGERTSKGNAGAVSPGSCIPLAMPGTFGKIPRWLTDKDGPLAIKPGYFPRAALWLLRFGLAARASRIEPIADALFALHSRTFDCYAPLLKNAQADDLIRRTGCLVVYESDEEFAASEREWEMRRRRGVPLQMLSADEMFQLEPNLSRHYRRGVLQTEHGYVVDPYRLVQRLAAKFIADGGRLVRGTAERFTRSDGKVIAVETSAGALVADHVVIAAGVWSRALMRQLGTDVPLESQRGYHVTLTAPSIEPRLPISPAKAKIYATPMEMGLRVAGTVEFAGIDAPPNFARARRLLVQVKAMYPKVDTAAFTEWMGQRPCLPDSLPVIGPLRDSPNVLLAFGHGHNGMTSGPVTGKVIADLVAGRPAAFDLAPYRADRF
jgi:D-amino-acid dehydrogenase